MYVELLDNEIMLKGITWSGMGKQITQGEDLLNKFQCSISLPKAQLNMTYRIGIEILIIRIF